MQQDVRFTCTALSQPNKQGILPKDEFGYRTMPIGALNAFNSVGDYYPYEAARNLFEKSSSFMRRVQSRCLKSEEGHPKPLPGQSEDSFIQRVMSIDEARVCAHIAEIYLDFNSLKDSSGRPIVAIMGKIKPAGAFGPPLEESFNNPREDVCFSVRAFTDNKRVAGIVQRNLIEIVTFDRVTEPGINTSRKFMSPALEAYSEAVFSKEAIDRSISSKPSGISMESATLSPDELYRSLGWETSNFEPPKYLGW